MKNIAIVCGGFSHESVISLLSAKTVLSELSNKNYNLFEVRISKDGWIAFKDGDAVDVNKADFSIIWGENKLIFDCAFITIHGTPGEDGIFQGYLELLGIPYTTANQFCTALTFNKWFCNQQLKQIGVPCAHSLLLRSPNDVNYKKINFKIGIPCMVKPNAGGSSFGITKVTEPNQLKAAIHSAFMHDNEVLIEAFMEGRELSCGIFKLKNKITVLPLTEIISENDFFDYDAKYNGKSHEITPANISTEICDSVERTTKYIYESLGLRGMARIDYIIIDGTPHVIEINITPGLSQQSIIPQQIRTAGLQISDIFEGLIEEALLRKNC